MAVPARSAAGDGSGPALWKAVKGDNIFYLFGSMHSLPEYLDWLTPPLRSVLAEIDTIWFEAPLQLEGGKNIPVFRDRKALAAGRLDSEQLSALRGAAGELGIDHEKLLAKPIWHIDAALTGAYLRRRQYYSSHGVEHVLARQAKARKIAIRYLESTHAQQQILEDLPVEDQIASLMQTIEQIQSGSDELHSLTMAWFNGEIGALYMLLEQNTEQEIRQQLLSRRNLSWVEQIDSVAATESGTSLLVMGAAHLSGPDAVDILLRRRGFLVWRIN